MAYKSLPVEGYKDQDAEPIALVNHNKMLEEKTLRVLDELTKLEEVDKRWLAIGRTHIEQGFMAVNRAIFQPNRVRLLEDE